MKYLRDERGVITECAFVYDRGAVLNCFIEEVRISHESQNCSRIYNYRIRDVVFNYCVLVSYELTMDNGFLELVKYV